MGRKRRKGMVSAVAKGKDGYCEESSFVCYFELGCVR